MTPTTSTRIGSQAWLSAGWGCIDAVRAAREAVPLEPHEWRTHDQLADALDDLPPPIRRGARKRQHEEAWNAAMHAISLAPLEAGPRCTVGFLLLKQNAPQRAEQAFRDALRIDPNDVRARNGLGLTGLGTGRLISAVGDFGAAVAADPSRATARSNIDVTVHTATLRLCFGLLGALVVCGPLLLLPVLASRIAAVVGVLAMVVWGARIWQRVPRQLHGYLLRLPRKDFGLTVTLAVVLLAALLLITAMVVSDSDARGVCFLLAVHVTLGAFVIRRLAGLWRRLRS